MKQTSRFLLLLSIAVLIAGCKLAVIVVEGGEVQSTGSGTCSAGTICNVEVDDTNFSETFTAVPVTGWYFEKWNSGGGFLCAESTDPACAVSSEEAEGLPAWEALLASSKTFYIMPIFVPSQPKVWLQPADFIGYTYDQINAMCPAGKCSGTLPGSTFDLTGYTWASFSDVEALFNRYSDEMRSILEDFTATDEWENASIFDDTSFVGGMVRDSALHEEFAYIDASNVGTVGHLHFKYGVWLWKSVDEP
jgi:hypothetical protein